MSQSIEGSAVVFLTDSFVVLCALMKGRSSAHQLSTHIRRASALLIAVVPGAWYDFTVAIATQILCVSIRGVSVVPQ